MAYGEASVVTCDVAHCGTQAIIIGHKTASENYKKLETLGWHSIEGYGIVCPDCSYQHDARAAQPEGER